jgi:DNA repair protein RadD
MQGSLFGGRLLFDGTPANIVLRPYQQAAVEAAYRYLRTRDDNPVIVIPTAGGKTPVLAQICRDAVCNWQGRVLVLAHVKELLEQSADKLRAMCPRDVSIGVHSAGLNRRDVRQSVIVAGIQSIYRRAGELDAFDLVLVDEAHLIPPEGDGMYRQFLADARLVNPNLRIIGLTATPFRLKSGMICTDDGFLNAICYEVGVRELIVEGFLSPLVTKNATTRIDTSAVQMRAGEFVAEQAEAAFDVAELVRAAVAEIVSYTATRKSVLVFCCGVEHGQHVAAAFRQDHGIDCGFVCGETPDRERQVLLDRFRGGEQRYLANVNVLTTGFDAPNIDAVALLRPTNSPGLYYQMVGRGFRIHPGKADCLVLDFGGNVLRHGPVDRIKVGDQAKGNGKGGQAIAKECPECHAAIAGGYAVCPDCGYEFPPPQKQRHEATASEAGILSGEVTLSSYPVDSVIYSVHTKRNASQAAPKTLRVDYFVSGGFDCQSEWICLEHDSGSFPHRKAAAWWQARSPDPLPLTAERAVEIIEGGGLAETLEITVRSVTGERFDRVVDYVLGPKPQPLEFSAPRGAAAVVDDGIPF